MIKIEVTGSSIAEVADKLLAIGANLRGNAIVEGARAAVNAMKAMNPVMPEVAEMAAAPEPRTSETSAPTPDTSSSSASKLTEQPSPNAGPAAPEPAAETTVASSSASAATASPSEPVISAEALRDLVLSVVRVKGREAMVAVLDTFGAAKASDVPAAQVPELVAALEALL